MAGDTRMLQLILEKVSSIEERVIRMEGKQDNLHASLRYLEDDTPTNTEFRKLKRRVEKVEKKINLV